MNRGAINRGITQGHNVFVAHIICQKENDIHLLGGAGTAQKNRCGGIIRIYSANAIGVARLTAQATIIIIIGICLGGRNEIPACTIETLNFKACFIV